MTQHFLTPTDPSTADTVMIGHDRMLDTFFAQVYKQTGDDPQWVLWKGLSRSEITSADSVIALVRDYAHIPAGLLPALDFDYTEAPYYTSEQANTATFWSSTESVDADTFHAARTSAPTA